MIYSTANTENTGALLKKQVSLQEGGRGSGEVVWCGVVLAADEVLEPSGLGVRCDLNRDR